MRGLWKKWQQWRYNSSAVHHRFSFKVIIAYFANVPSHLVVLSAIPVFVPFARTLYPPVFWVHCTFMSVSYKHAIIDSDFVSGAAIWRTRQNTTFRVTLAMQLAPFCQNTTSSAKPEIRGALHYRQRRTEPRPRVTCTENLVRFVMWFLRYESGQTNIHTYRHADRNTSQPYRGEVKNL